LTPEQRRVFQTTVASMADAGLVPLDVDMDLIAAYSVAVVTHRAAAQQLAGEPLVIDTGRETRRNPLCILINQQAVLVDKLAGSLKIFLSDRDRTRKSEPGDESFAAHLARL